MPASKDPRPTTDSGIFSPMHPLEYEVIRKLRLHPSIKISSLVVRRVPDGICLEGWLESSPHDPELAAFLREAEELATVVNRLVCCRQPPPKG